MQTRGPERAIINTALIVAAPGAQQMPYTAAAGHNRPTPARMMFGIISDAITAANEAMHGQTDPPPSSVPAGTLCPS